MRKYLSGIFSSSIDEVISSIRLGDDINTQDRFTGNTPLHYAILRQDIDMINTLLDFGAELNIKNNDNNKPFDLADMLRYDMGKDALNLKKKENLC